MAGGAEPITRSRTTTHGLELAPLTLAAAWDALVSVQHLATVGRGDNALSAVFRLAAMAGPIIGTTALVWATDLASGFASRRRR